MRTNTLRLVCFVTTSLSHSQPVHYLASQKSLLETKQAILNAYLHLGYLDAYVDAHPQKDATAHTVSYSLQVIPGETYHVKTVTPLNLSAAAQKDFDFGWLLKPGVAYDPLYTSNFLTNNTALRNLAGYTASFQAAADSHTSSTSPSTSSAPEASSYLRLPVTPVPTVSGCPSCGTTFNPWLCTCA